MEEVSSDRFGGRDAGGLLAFLRYCREKARADRAPRIASISLRVRDLDPLAVLRSIQEPDQPHLYLERSPVSVSGAESVALLSATGADRFAEARRFVDDWSERIVATGDLDGWFSGPLFFHAFAFAEDNDPSCTVFVPRWQVCRTEMECVAVANVRVDEGTDLAAEGERILRAHATFADLAYGGSKGGWTPPPRPVVEEEDPELFRGRVRKALAAIAAGDLEKVVLARWRDLVGDSEFRPLELLRELRERFPDCYAFSYSRGNRASWIGATPETLIRQTADRFETEAIAGSAPRGGDLDADTALGRGLLSSAKDLREHAVVVGAVRRALEGLGLEVRTGRHPHLLRLSNVQHLRTPVTGPRDPGLRLLALAEALHPTPAVGGNPRGAALERIGEWEPFPRGLYTGFLGWEKPGGEGQSVVALRTGRVEGNRARLFAGAGIVEGSEPDRELRETEIKLEAMGEVVGRGPAAG